MMKFNVYDYPDVSANDNLVMLAVTTHVAILITQAYERLGWIKEDGRSMTTFITAL